MVLLCDNNHFITIFHIVMDGLSFDRFLSTRHYLSLEFPFVYLCYLGKFGRYNVICVIKFISLLQRKSRYKSYLFFFLYKKKHMRHCPSCFKDRYIIFVTFVWKMVVQKYIFSTYAHLFIPSTFIISILFRTTF